MWIEYSFISSKGSLKSTSDYFRVENLSSERNGVGKTGKFRMYQNPSLDSCSPPRKPKSEWRSIRMTSSLASPLWGMSPDGVAQRTGFPTGVQGDNPVTSGKDLPSG